MTQKKTSIKVISWDKSCNQYLRSTVKWKLNKTKWQRVLFPLKHQYPPLSRHHRRRSSFQIIKSRRLTSKKCCRRTNSWNARWAVEKPITILQLKKAKENTRKHCCTNLRVVISFKVLQWIHRIVRYLKSRMLAWIRRMSEIWRNQIWRNSLLAWNWVVWRLTELRLSNHLRITMTTSLCLSRLSVNTIELVQKVHRVSKTRTWVKLREDHLLSAIVKPSVASHRAHLKILRRIRILEDTQNKLMFTDFQASTYSISSRPSI